VHAPNPDRTLVNLYANHISRSGEVRNAYVMGKTTNLKKIFSSYGNVKSVYETKIAAENITLVQARKQRGPWGPGIPTAQWSIIFMLFCVYTE